jgi:hypothetical protein
MINRLFGLLALIIAGLLVYGGIIFLLKVPEFQELLSHAKRFRRRL